MHLYVPSHQPKGASINDVRTEGGGCQKIPQICAQTAHKIRIKEGEEGVKKSKNVADVIYGSPLSKGTPKSQATQSKTLSRWIAKLHELANFENWDWTFWNSARPIWIWNSGIRNSGTLDCLPAGPVLGRSSPRGLDEPAGFDEGAGLDTRSPVVVQGPLAAVDVFKVHLSTDLVGFSQSLQSWNVGVRLRHELFLLWLV